MKGEFRITNPDDVPMTLTLTMKCREWKELRARISDRWPGWEMQVIIDEMVLKAEQVVEETVEVARD